MSTQSQSSLRPSRHIFFIDENLGSTKLPALLRSAGYKVVTHFERYGNVDGIDDPTIIADCGGANMILLTADGDLETTWAGEILAARIAIVILSNNKDGAVKWGGRLASGRRTIIEHLRLYKKPCAICFGSDSKVARVRLYGTKRARVIRP